MSLLERVTDKVAGLLRRSALRFSPVAQSCREAASGARLRWEQSLALQVYTMLLPLAVSGIWVGAAAWNGMQYNASEVLEANRVKQDLLELQGLMLTQADASKVMILHQDDDTAGSIKIRAFDAHEVLLSSLEARTTKLPSIHLALQQLRQLDESGIKPADMEIVEALSAGNTAKAQEIHNSRFLPAKRRYESSVRQMLEEAERAAQTANTKMGHRNTASLVHIVFALVCGFGVATAGLVLLLRNRILRPLTGIRDALAAVASGDFSVCLAEENRNELGQTACAVNHMVRAVRESMSGMVVESQAMSQQAGRLYLISESMVKETRGVSETCDSLSQAGSEVARNIRDASDHLRTISQSVEDVTSKAQQSANRISEAQVLSHNTNEAVLHLRQSTQAIDEIADFIVRLTFETNILALNATIEAARYGEAGAGFRVIAQQVKALADQTKSATAQISGHVSKIGSDVAASVHAMKQMKQLFDSVTEISTSVAAETQNQNRATQSLNQTVSDIAAHGEHIAKSLQNMATAIGQASVLACDTRESAVEVSTASRSLGRLLTRFKSNQAPVSDPPGN